MSNDAATWAQAEFNALRAEILALSDAARKTIKFYLPLAAAIYGVPYVLARLDDPLLWSICTGVSSLLLLGMTQSLFWTTESVRRIGTYIKEVVEPRTDGAMLWETVYFRLEKNTRGWPGEEFVMAGVPTLANLVAATGAGIAFLKPDLHFLPVATAAVPSIVAVWYLYNLFRSADVRERYSVEIAKLRDIGYERQARLPIRPEHPTSIAETSVEPPPPPSVLVE